MRILILHTNRNRFLTPPPLGPAMIADSAAASHDVQLFDFMFKKEPAREAIRVIKEFQPDVIGVSLRNLDDQDSRTDYSPIAALKPFIADVRQTSQALIVLGGGAFTTLPAEILNFFEADYGIAGQGEKVFPRLIEQIERGTVDTNLPGLVFREDGKTTVNPTVIEGYPESFTPEQWFYDPKPYMRNPWPGIVLIKTGCPYRCVYCNARTIQGRTPKLRDPQVIVSEIENQVRQLNVRIFHLSDPCFGAPPDHAKEVLEAIIQSGLHIVAMTILRPNDVEEELLTLMKRAGIIFVALGADTLSQTTLETYQKGFSIGQVEQSCKLLQKHGIGYMIECVLGGPGETEKTLEESLAFLHKVKPTLTLLNAGIRILPEAPIYQIAAEEGLVKDPSELLLPKYYFSKDIAPETLYRRIDTYNRRYGRRNARMIPLVVRARARALLGRLR